MLINSSPSATNLPLVLSGNNMKSTALYSNPIKALIRELSCNAVEATSTSPTPHAPIDVFLPTASTPFSEFIVYDEGCGLSASDIQAMYLSNEKNSEPKQVRLGKFGIGAMAPFAYLKTLPVEQAYITLQSAHQGITRTYDIRLDANGVPCVTLTKEQPSIKPWPHGVCIRIPVAAADSLLFEIEAEHVFKFFEHPIRLFKGTNRLATQKTSPKIQFGDSLFVTTKPSQDASLDELFNSNLSLDDTIHFVMDGVCYPVESSWLIEHFEDGLLQSVVNGQYFIKVNAGDLTVTPSRESILFDASTSQIVRSKVHQLILNEVTPFIEVYDQIRAQFSSAWETLSFINSIPIDHCHTPFDSQFSQLAISESLLNRYVRLASRRCFIQEAAKLLVGDIKANLVAMFYNPWQSVEFPKWFGRSCEKAPAQYEVEKWSVGQASNPLVYSSAFVPDAEYLSLVNLHALIYEDNGLTDNLTQPRIAQYLAQHYKQTEVRSISKLYLIKESSQAPGSAKSIAFALHAELSAMYEGFPAPQPLSSLPLPSSVSAQHPHLPAVPTTYLVLSQECSPGMGFDANPFSSVQLAGKNIQELSSSNSFYYEVSLNLEPIDTFLPSSVLKTPEQISTLCVLLSGLTSEKTINLIPVLSSDILAKEELIAHQLRPIHNALLELVAQHWDSLRNNAALITALDETYFLAESETLSFFKNLCLIRTNCFWLWDKLVAHLDSDALLIQTIDMVIQLSSEYLSLTDKKMFEPVVTIPFCQLSSLYSIIEHTAAHLDCVHGTSYGSELALPPLNLAAFLNARFPAISEIDVSSLEELRAESQAHWDSEPTELSQRFSQVSSIAAALKLIDSRADPFIAPITLLKGRILHEILPKAKLLELQQVTGWEVPF